MFHIPTSSPKITRMFGFSVAFADEAIARNSNDTSEANWVGRMINFLYEIGYRPRTEELFRKPCLIR
jgi:hypothetical protein